MNAARTISIGAISAPCTGGTTSDRLPWEFTVNVVGVSESVITASLRITATWLRLPGTSATATSRSRNWGRSRALFTEITR